MDADGEREESPDERSNVNQCRGTTKGEGAREQSPTGGREKDFGPVIQLDQLLIFDKIVKVNAPVRVWCVSEPKQYCLSLMNRCPHYLLMIFIKGPMGP